MIDLPVPLLFTPDERLKLPGDLREVSAAVALAAIVDVGNHLVENYDSMTETEQAAAVALAEQWPKPEETDEDRTPMPEALLQYLPAGWGDPPQGKELIRQRSAVARDRLQYMRDWQRYSNRATLDAELNRLIKTGDIPANKRQEAIKHLESGQPLVIYVQQCDAMREMEKMLHREQRRANNM